MEVKTKIYVITNNINGKQYVGQTITSLARRFCSHFHPDKRRPRAILHGAMNKYDKDNFSISLLKVCKDEQEADKVEKLYIAKLNTISPNGYNIENGGRRNRGLLSLETKIKMRKKKSPEAIKKYKAIIKTPEWRSKISKARLGQKANKNQLEGLKIGWHMPKNTSGINNGRCRLNPKEVIEIRRLYATGKINQTILGKLFNLPQVTVSAIVTRKTWKNLY